MLAGLARCAHDELVALPGLKLEREEAAGLTFRYRGPTALLKQLRRVVAVYRLERFDLPRPKALLGDEHFRRLRGLVTDVAAQDVFRGFRLAAAGSDSPVFQRLTAALERSTGLPYRPDDGELLLRVRPFAEGGWEVLARLTPRPLSVRPWRVCNLPGGLNATVAVCAHDLLGVRPDERYLNAMCGSGTLLIERALSGPAAQLVGCDLDAAALDCARANVAAAGLVERITLLHEDATALDLPAGSFEVVTADLPWGDAVGSVREAASLYPRFLAEMARVTTARGRLLVITHALQLFERALAVQTHWRGTQVGQVAHGGHHPRLYLLEKPSALLHRNR